MKMTVIWNVMLYSNVPGGGVFCRTLVPVFISNTLLACLLCVQHYLSYLNCLRVKELCGAIDSLLHCFDRNSLVSDSKGNNNQEEKSRAFRYAALNLAVLHAQFGHQ
jgi:hypothetical protein